MDFSTNPSDGKIDPRSPRRRMVETVETWSYILGLATMAIVWALISLHEVGSTTMHQFDYHLSQTTPASQPWNVGRP